MPASALPDGELAFTYFPGNYRWSHGVLIALGGAPWGGAEIDEVHRIGLRLKTAMATTSHGSTSGPAKRTASNRSATPKPRKATR